MDSGMLSRIDRMRNANVAAMYMLQTGTVGILSSLSCSAQKVCPVHKYTCTDNGISKLNYFVLYILATRRG